jgi:predicted PurR-regulated permease PerM
MPPVPPALSAPVAPAAPADPRDAACDTANGESSVTPLRTPIDLPAISLVVLAVVASVFALQWAKAVFIPLLLGLMLSYTLSPLVDRMARWRVPRALGAAVLLIGLLAGLSSAAYSLADDATDLLQSLPDAAQKLGLAVRTTRGAPESSMQKVQRAAARLEQAAEESGPTAPAASKGVTRVQIERPRFNLKDYLWSGTLGLAGAVGQALVVVSISFFLMASGNRFRRKMVRIAGPAFSQKRITLQVLDEITDQIHRYLTLQVTTSLGVGLVTWLVLLWIGLDRAAVWGVAAALLNLVPYLGALVLTGGLALGGFMQFGSAGSALLLGSSSLLIHIVSGNLIAPWLNGRTSRMSPVVIFVGLLAWGWLWGLWGLLLGVPLLMVVKVVCDRVEDLKPIGELLGD